MSKLQPLLTALVGLLIVAIGGGLGALSLATTGLLVAGGMYLLGFVAMGTAKALLLWISLLGVLVGAGASLAFTSFAAVTIG